MLSGVRALLLLALVVLLVGGGMKLAGVPIPFLDYSVGPMGEGRRPGMPDVVIEAPGFGDAQELP
jgi:hypothetical protein